MKRSKRSCNHQNKLLPLHAWIVRMTGGRLLDGSFAFGKTETRENETQTKLRHELLTRSLVAQTVCKIELICHASS